ncbi:MAG: hypothetical protein U0O13_02175, partial [Oscillospiraceae bacterium]
MKDEKRKNVCASNTQTFSHITAQNATPRPPGSGGGRGDFQTFFYPFLRQSSTARMRAFARARA